MSIDLLCDRTLVAFTRGPGSVVEDEYHNPIATETETAGSWPCSISPLEGQELTTGRATEISRFLLVVIQNAYGVLPVLDANDRVTVDEVAYELEGPPLSFGRPFEDPHHIEAKVRAVTG
jgi:hypothetical protein